MIKNKNILITGGAGFIGSHLAKFLVAKGNNIYVIDNLNTSSKKNIQFSKKFKKNFFFIKSSIQDYSKLETLIKKVDIIFHLAASVGVKNIMRHPTFSILNNLNTSKIIFEFASKYKKRIIFTSSSEVYGLSNRILLEDARVNLGNPKLIRWNYACTKLSDEFLAMSYFIEKKMKITIVRLFNTIGEGQSDQYGMVIPRFFAQAIRNKPITVYGNGKQSRTFTYVEDVVRSLIKLINVKKSYGEVINVGGANKITILSLAKKIKLITKSKSKVKFISIKKVYGKSFEDCKTRIPSVAKLKKLIKYSPNTSLDEILVKILNKQKN